MFVKKLNILTISLILLSFASGSGAFLCSAANMTVTQNKNGGNRAKDETLITFTTINAVPLKESSLANTSAVLSTGAILQLTPVFNLADADVLKDYTDLGGIGVPVCNN